MFDCALRAKTCQEAAALLFTLFLPGGAARLGRANKREESAPRGEELVATLSAAEEGNLAQPFEQFVSAA